MSDTPRLVIAAIVTRLQAIATGSGYNTSAGSRVYMGVRNFDAVINTFPLLSVFSGSERAEKLTFNSYLCSREIVIAGHVNDISTPTEALEYLVEDVQRALELPDGTLGGLVLTFGYDGIDVLGPREDGGTISTMVVRYAIEYARDYGG